MDEIVAFEEKRTIERYGERKCGAIAEVEAGSSVDALAVAVICPERQASLMKIERHDLKVVVANDEVPKALRREQTVASPDHNAAFVQVDGRHRKPFRSP